MQANALHSFLHVSSFHGYCDNCLGIGSAASFTWFSCGEPPHGFKPIGDWFFRAVHNRTGDQWMMALTRGANIKITSIDPVLGMAAFLLGETIRPFLFEQIIVTSLWVWKTFIELYFTFWKIFGDRTIRGKLSQSSVDDPAVYERVQFMKYFK